LKSEDWTSLLLFYSSCGDVEGMTTVMVKSEAHGKYNVAYQAAYLLALPDKCIEIMVKSKRIAEAAMFARAYCPSKLPEIIKVWNELLKVKDLPFQPEDLL
jgi:coatomer subunit beta'